MKSNAISFWDDFSYPKYENYVKYKILNSGYIHDGKYKISKDGLKYGQSLICNFFFFIRSVKNEIEESKETKQYVILSIRHISHDNGSILYDDPQEYILSVQDIRSTTKLLNRIDITCRVFDKNAFRDILDSMIETALQTSTYIISRTGWQEEGSYAFANGVVGGEKQYDLVAPKGNIAKHKLKIDPNSVITPEQERSAAQLLFSNLNRIEDDKPVFFFLYLYQLLSLLSTPLRERYDSRAPRFIAVITGDPSVGKTGICKWLIGYREYSPTIDLSTGSTESGFFDEAKESSDCIFLTDDFKVNPSHRKQVEDLIETLTRVGGNNSEKKNARGSFQMRGSILLTAEFLPPLSDSSLNRMLEWHIGFQDNNWKYLNAISDNPEAYATHYLSFLKWIIAKGKDELCANMFSAFENIKSEIQHEYPYCERRIDAYAWLLAAYREVLCKYLAEIEVPLCDEMYQRLFAYASNTLKEYQRDVLEKDVIYKLCMMIYNDSLKLHIRDDSLPLKTNEIGFKDADFVYITKEGMESVVKEIGAIDTKSLTRKLDDAQLLTKNPGRYGCVRITHKGIEYLTYCISKAEAKDYRLNIDKLLDRMK